MSKQFSLLEDDNERYYFSSFCAEKVVSHVKQESKFKMPYFFFVKQFSQQIPL